MIHRGRIPRLLGIAAGLPSRLVDIGQPATGSHLAIEDLPPIRRTPRVTVSEDDDGYGRGNCRQRHQPTAMVALLQMAYRA